MGEGRSTRHVESDHAGEAEAGARAGTRWHLRVARPYGRQGQGARQPAAARSADDTRRGRARDGSLHHLVPRLGDHAHRLALPLLTREQALQRLRQDEDCRGAGLSANGVENQKDGFFTRGILVDIPLMKGVPYLEPGTPITPADLEAWEKFANVKIGSGDAVFLRTGRWVQRA